VAAVIERFAPAFWQRYGQRITVDQRRALQSILQCRTEALGGHRYDCACGHSHHAYHSCNHRLCPRCGAADTEAWVGKQLDKRLPVSYYLVTFTLPSSLRPVIRGNREALNGFMQCSAQALRELLANPRRGGFHRSGFFGVYQSWTQDMRFHPHVHYVVPAVGLDAGWRLKQTKQRKFLVYAEALAKRLRTLLTDRLREQGLICPSRFRQLRRIDWNASVDPAGRGENAIKYLGQYVRHSVIRDGRIVAIESRSKTTTSPFASRIEKPANPNTAGLKASSSSAATSSTSCPAASTVSATTATSTPRAKPPSSGSSSFSTHAWPKPRTARRRPPANPPARSAAARCGAPPRLPAPHHGNATTTSFSASPHESRKRPTSPPSCFQPETATAPRVPITKINPKNRCLAFDLPFANPTQGPARPQRPTPRSYNPSILTRRYAP